MGMFVMILFSLVKERKWVFNNDISVFGKRLKCFREDLKIYGNFLIVTRCDKC